MDSLLPNCDPVKAVKLYGKYKNIRETSVRLCDHVSLQYFLLSGSQAEDDRQTVYSVLCVMSEDGVITDSEFLYDLSRTQSEAERVFYVLCRNTVTPCCMLEVIENVLSDIY